RKMCFVNRASRNPQNPFALWAHFILLSFYIPTAPFMKPENIFQNLGIWP
ncbi:hypothetical protein SAMN06269173_1331, partial [Hymenobacter mucosus]